MSDEVREGGRQWTARATRFLLLTAHCLLLTVFLVGATSVRAQSDDDEGFNKPDSSTAAADAAKRLVSRDPLVRQRAAEELADLSAADWRRLVEGYRLQESDARVKLALDWALYRMGKTETLYAVVGALDSSRHAQAQSYLSKMESPEPLYIFLESGNTKAKVRLLEVLARTGDAGTVERIRPYTTALDPQVARAARASISEINARLAQAPPDAPTRPRRVGNESEEDSP
jgi:hypothetical protein